MILRLYLFSERSKKLKVVKNIIKTEVIYDDEMKNKYVVCC